MNRISVIIPSYQHGKVISRCIDSLLAQTRKPDEIIVVDDGSTDDTQKNVQPFIESIRYIFQNNSGAQAARMNGYAKTTGNLLLFCDADVVMHPDMLETLEKALREHSGASYAYSSFRWGPKLFRSRAFDPGELKEMNYIHTTALIRREHFPGFDLEIKKFQDWDVWLTMLEQGHEGVFVDKVLFQVVHENDRLGISKWLPSFFYKIPWHFFGWKPNTVKTYEKARDVIFTKHNL